MPVRDVLWACPACRTTGGIRPRGGRERCTGCGAIFRRGRGARIAIRTDEAQTERPTGEWLRELGPPIPPHPSPDGRILGPEIVRVKFTRHQEPLHWRGHMLGWIELYERAERGTLLLHTDGLRLSVMGRPETHWTPDQITGVQPASSSIQLRVGDRMASFKFIEGSVRLWTAALTHLLRDYHAACGRDVIELQPFVRTRERGSR